MLDRTEDMKFGIEQILKYFPVKRVVIGIEKNKGAAIDKMKSIAASDPKITVKILPSIYPQGGEKVLIYHTTGKVVPAGKLPIDVGCIVCNCTTVAAIGSYIKTGMPLVKKCITLDGGAIASPKNVIAPIGASIKEIIELSSGFKCEPAKILLGGPMMGTALADTNVPVVRNTNGIVAMTRAEAALREPSACIRCARCVAACPMRLSPFALERATARGDLEALSSLDLMNCMECGSCAFVCPASRPLAQNMRLGKALLRAAAKKK
jgi:electron transport complex protein RnfC